jgi:large conductance mechanosensitive channel
MHREFREFIARGNVFDLAVGVVIGAAFAKIVDSFVKDILMPPVGLLTGGVDFSSLFVSLDGGSYATLAAAQEAAAPTLNYGLFINALLQFLIVAFALFLFVRQYNRLRRADDAAPAAPTERPCPFCLLHIPVAATRCGHCTSQLQP